MQAVFLEYAWDMSWCDPCAADPLSFEELRELGVFWILDQMQPAQPLPQPRGVFTPDVFVTRLHLRYDGEHFAEDLHFRETAEREQLPGPLRAAPPLARPAVLRSRAGLSGRSARALRAAGADSLAPDPLADRGDPQRMESAGQSFTAPESRPPTSPWWEKLWPDD